MSDCPFPANFGFDMFMQRSSTHFQTIPNPCRNSINSGWEFLLHSGYPHGKRRDLSSGSPGKHLGKYSGHDFAFGYLHHDSGYSDTLDSLDTLVFNCMLFINLATVHPPR